MISEKQVKQENLRLQEERQALIDAYFAPGWLDDSPICSRCGGTGYIGSTMCECLAELCRQEQKKELTLLAGCDASFDQFRLDCYPDANDPKLGVNIRTVMARTYDVCRQYARNFCENAGNLLFSGDTGLGKTFLSAGKGDMLVWASKDGAFGFQKLSFGKDNELVHLAVMGSEVRLPAALLSEK